MARLTSLFRFTAGPVTIVLCAVYLALPALLLYIHHVVPSAPSVDAPLSGVNLTHAWRDLQHLSSGFHPFNSHRNDDVRSWLLQRLDQILTANNVSHTTETAWSENSIASEDFTTASSPAVILFDDRSLNITLNDSSSQFTYVESTNIIVYIRGQDDGEEWWRSPGDAHSRPRGVLVNAHYDSVSTGRGATDDGVGVISLLQLISHFTSHQKQPRRGIVFLFNNGEEDYLRGASVFTRHPISQFPSTFLNLEGAGAGGRATLFRSTDASVTKAYARAKHPFGAVLSNDAFDRGIIASQTDYVIFNAPLDKGGLDLRGLDVAFMEPRARYHTAQDSTRYTSRDSLWHMLGSALSTVDALANEPGLEDDGHADPPKGVWFDLFGRVLAHFSLTLLFAITVVLLIVPPLLYILLAVLLFRQDKFYFLATSRQSDPLDPATPADPETITFHGWRGIFRYPVAFALASAAVIGLALLQNKTNPFLIESSPYAIWSMMLSAWFVVAWFVLRGSDSVRPTALHRTYAFFWILGASWVVMVGVAIAENQLKLAGVYLLVFMFAAIALCVMISMLELFALSKKSDYVRNMAHSIESERSTLAPPAQHAGRRLGRSPTSRSATRSSEEAEPTETTSLLSNTFSRRLRQVDEAEESQSTHKRNSSPEPYNEEQVWSGRLPSWTWLLQFLLFAPITLILVGQVGLLQVSAMYQTPADGNSPLVVYLAMGVISILLLVPASPFLHRFTYRVPLFIFAIFIAALIYNLLAFPFSAENRLKTFFVQQISLDTGVNNVVLTSLDDHVQQIVHTLPSADGQLVDCSEVTTGVRKGLTSCAWHGLHPRVVAGTNTSAFSSANSKRKNAYTSWLNYTITRTKKRTDEATIDIVGANTRSCKVIFDTPISAFAVEDLDYPAPESRFTSVGAITPVEIRLWHRQWEQPWRVRFRWDEDSVDGTTSSKPSKGPKGKVICNWSDQNERGTIPALDELRLYMPPWATVTKLVDGLVEGSKAFTVT